MFIGAQADVGLAPATLAHRLAAIRLVHLGQGLPSPHNTLVVMEVMRGIRRQRAKVGGGAREESTGRGCDYQANGRPTRC